MVLNVKVLYDTESNDLRVVKLDLNLKGNGKGHHTDEYDAMEKGSLVVRRGDVFNIQITFNRSYDKGNDDLKLVFTTGMSNSMLQLHIKCIEVDKKYGYVTTQ